MGEEPSQKPTRKPAVIEAMRRAGMSQYRLARVAGVTSWVVWKAVSYRVGVEDAGLLCRVLGDHAGLSTAERKELFAGLVNHPGDHTALYRRVSTEDPFSFLWDAVNGD